MVPVLSHQEQDKDIYSCGKNENATFLRQNGKRREGFYDYKNDVAQEKLFRWEFARLSC